MNNERGARVEGKVHPSGTLEAGTYPYHLRSWRTNQCTGLRQGIRARRALYADGLTAAVINAVPFRAEAEVFRSEWAKNCGKNDYSEYGRYEHCAYDISASRI